MPGGQVPPQIRWNPPHVKPVVDVVDEVEVEVMLELVGVVEVVGSAIEVLVVAIVVVVETMVLLVVLVLVVLLGVVLLGVGGLLVVLLEVLLVVVVLVIVVGAPVVVVELLLLVVVGGSVDVVLDGIDVLTVLERVLLLELEVLVDPGNGCVVRVVLVVVEIGRGRNVEDVVLDGSRGAGQLAGFAALRAAKRPGASRFTAPPSKSRQ